MKLTGKAKEDFEKWLSDTDIQNILEVLEYNGALMSDNLFSELPKSMQWGVYQDWADRLGVHLSVYMGVEESIGYEFDITTIEKRSIPTYPFERKVKETNGVGGYQTREQARNAAVEKLNELINNN